MNERNHNKGEKQFIVQQRSSCIHNILMLITLWFILGGLDCYAWYNKGAFFGKFKIPSIRIGQSKGQCLGGKIYYYKNEKQTNLEPIFAVLTIVCFFLNNGSHSIDKCWVL